MVIIAIYRPPNTNTEKFDDFLHQIKSIEELTTAPTKNVMLMGDLNFPFIKWPGPSWIAGKGSSQDKIQLSKLLDYTESLFMT